MGGVLAFHKGLKKCAYMVKNSTRKDHLENTTGRLFGQPFFASLSSFRSLLCSSDEGAVVGLDGLFEACVGVDEAGELIDDVESSGSRHRITISRPYLFSHSHNSARR